MQAATKTCSRLGLLLVAVLMIFATGCSVTLHEGLSEQEANEIVNVLRDVGGIDAEKLSGEDEFYKVEVPGGHLAQSLSLLREHNLPRKPYPEVDDVFPPGGLIPTDTEEQARLRLAMQGTLANTLLRIDGVVDARVHIVNPERDPLESSEDRTPKASVLVKYLQEHRAGIDEGKIKRLVANAVENLDAQNVEVLASPVQARQRMEGAAEYQTLLGLIKVSTDSYWKLVWAMLSVLGLALVAVGAAIYSIIRWSATRREVARLRADRERLRSKMGKFLKRSGRSS